MTDSIRQAGMAALFALSSLGCAMGNQPVVWQVANPVDFGRGVEVEVGSSVPVPPGELAILRQNVVAALSGAFRSAPGGPDDYHVRVTLTRYDEGSKAARFFLAGLGQMYLDGSVQVYGGNPPAIVRQGVFNKNYAVGGIMGASANMNDDMISKVGTAIADGLRAPPGRP
ncbi:MAG TPA: DUF4410 domain-containing protein [Polyangia bacterium]